MRCTIYNKYTGVIRAVSRNADPGDCEEYIEGIYSPVKYYIDISTRKPVEKKEMILIYEGDTIKNVPPDSIFVIRELGDRSTLISDDITLEVEKPGIYHITILHTEYKPKYVTMEIK